MLQSWEAEDSACGRGREGGSETLGWWAGAGQSQCLLWGGVVGDTQAAPIQSLRGGAHGTPEGLSHPRGARGGWAVTWLLPERLQSQQEPAPMPGLSGPWGVDAVRSLKDSSFGFSLRNQQTLRSAQ